MQISEMSEQRSLQSAIYESPLGKITMVSDGEAIKGLWIEGQRHDISFSCAMPARQPLPIFAQTGKWLDDYFAGKQPGPLPPIVLEGTDFRRRVWELLREIPYGEVCTYKEIAIRLAKERGRESMSAQAVGGAVGSNPVAILIPCHRVIGKGGRLVGYNGGLEKKDFLLKLERQLYAKMEVCLISDGKVHKKQLDDL